MHVLILLKPYRFSIVLARDGACLLFYCLLQVLAGYLMFGTVTGIMMALFLDNVGGAWDNAKKYIEVKLGVRGHSLKALEQQVPGSCTLWKIIERWAKPSLVAHVAVDAL